MYSELVQALNKRMPSIFPSGDAADQSYENSFDFYKIYIFLLLIYIFIFFPGPFFYHFILMSR